MITCSFLLSHASPFCAQVQFGLQWADKVLKEIGSMRKRRCLTLSSGSWRNLSSLSNSMVSPATPARLAVHELVDLNLVLRASRQEEELRKRGPKSKTRRYVCRGKCAYAECPANVEGYGGLLAARSCLHCNACREGLGAYYHLPCFFQCHSCGSSSNPRPVADVAAQTPGS